MGGRVVAAVVVVAVSLIGGSGALGKKKPLPDLCPGGRFPLATALVPGGTSPDAILISGTQVGIQSGCPTTTARQRQTRRGTKLIARWKGCGTLKGSVRLVALIDATTCETLTLRFNGRKVHQKLTAQVEVPGDAFGRSDDPLPPGAVMVTSDEWDDLMQRPDFHSLGPAQMAADAMSETEREAADQETVDGFFGQFPALRDQYLGGVDPNDAAIGPGDDGNFLLTRTDDSGAAQIITTMGPKSRRNWLATLVRGFPTLDNQVGLYRNYYDGLNAIDPALVGNLVPPDQASQLGLAALRGVNESLAIQFGQFLPAVPPPGGVPPPGYPGTCGGEEGAGDGIDRAGASSCATHKTGGVYANKNWFLKFRTTCVRSQGRRGTCWGFTTNAAVEVEVAKKHDRWINLSEQHLVFMTKNVWYPSVYGDNGGPPLDAILANGYTHPFEEQWDYNQSLSRTSDDTARRYTNSCVGYTPAESAFCSDTVHQGQVFCVDLLLFRFCGAVGPLTPTTSGFAPTRWAYIWDPGSTTRAFANLVWAVGIFQKPVLFAFPVTPSFDGPDGNGYVTYRGPHCAVAMDGRCTPAPGCECDRGGHLALITGLIDNSQLPAGAPTGLGGGYFILKNSWGNCYGDSGYAYLPYDWVKNLGGWAAVIDVN